MKLNNSFKLEWLGHSCFRLTLGNGLVLAFDPYGGEAKLPCSLSCDLLLCSHKHFDHYAKHRVLGDFTLIDAFGNYQFKGVKIEGISSFHDKFQGAKRGENIIFKVKAEGLTICHLGDIGQQLSAEIINKIGKVDVLLVPVGGVYTITAAEAVEYVEALNPKVVIPMHYKSSWLSELGSVEDFTDMCPNWLVIRNSNESLVLNQENISNFIGKVIVMKQLSNQK